MKFHLFVAWLAALLCLGTLAGAQLQRPNLEQPAAGQPMPGQFPQQTPHTQYPNTIAQDPKLQQPMVPQTADSYPQTGGNLPQQPLPQGHYGGGSQDLFHTEGEILGSCSKTYAGEGNITLIVTQLPKQGESDMHNVYILVKDQDKTKYNVNLVFVGKDPMQSAAYDLQHDASLEEGQQQYYGEGNQVQYARIGEKTKSKPKEKDSGEVEESGKTTALKKEEVEVEEWGWGRPGWGHRWGGGWGRRGWGWGGPGWGRHGRWGRRWGRW